MELVDRFQFQQHSFPLCKHNNSWYDVLNLLHFLILFKGFTISIPYLDFFIFVAAKNLILNEIGPQISFKCFNVSLKMKEIQEAQNIIPDIAYTRKINVVES